MLRTPRYLLVLLAAKSGQTFRLAHGKEIDSSIYFTLYRLGEIAVSFKHRVSVGPCPSAVGQVKVNKTEI